MRRVKIIGIYKITSPSGSIYVGQSSDINGRWSDYKCLDCKKQGRLYNSLKKHGVENHSFEIICKCKREELNHWEIFYINFYNSFNTSHGLNLKSGGDVIIFSDETREKLRQANLGKKYPYRKLTEEHKKNISKGNKGVNIGKKLSEETIAKLKSIFGENHPSYGKKKSDETRKKMSDSKKGKAPPNKGKKMSEKQRVGMMKPVSEERRLSMQPMLKALAEINRGSKHSQERKDKVWKTNRAKFISYEEARKWIIENLTTLGINSSSKYEKNKKLTPNNIPNYPMDFYRKEGWISWKHWFGLED